MFVEMWMSRDLITVRPQDEIVAAAMKMRKRKIGGLPVVDDRGKLVGIITESDIFDVIIELNKRASRQYPEPGYLLSQPVPVTPVQKSKIGGEVMIKKILLPIDGSDGAKPAAYYAKDLGMQYGATIHILYVIDPLLMWPAGLYGGSLELKIQKSMQEEGEENIEKMVQELEDLPIKRVIRDGHPAEQIIAYAEEEVVDLIVMGTHGRRGLRHMLLGSVAEEVVRLSPIPVMTVRMSSPSTTPET